MKIRKMIAAVLTATMVLAITGCSNNEAQKRMEKEMGVFEFDNDGDCAILAKYDGDASEVQIPAYTLQEKKVTKIGIEAFLLCENLSSVIIPETVTEIDNFAFNRCHNLKKVNIPNGVTRIGAGAFWACTSLTSITIPDSVTEIGDNPFEYCRDITVVHKGRSYDYKHIDDLCEVINGNSSGTGTVKTKNDFTYVDNNGGGILISNYLGDALELQIPDTIDGKRVTEICDDVCMFRDFTSVTIPNSVTRIGSNAFSCCMDLSSITIGNSVTEIGSSAFSSCTNLTSVTIPNSVTKIETAAFADCPSLIIKYKGKTYNNEHLSDLYRAINGY